MLSPDPQERTTILLGQISQQLAGFQNNTYPPFQDFALFSPTTAIIWVNALWFLSLVTSIVSAFYVMLVQQWIRRYTQMIADLSGSQGRVRSSLFLGTQKYRMSHAIGLIPWPLHISVFLFFSGLIIFLFTISHTIATVVAVCVGVFGLTYFGLTIIPTIDDVCPYFTPMSDGWWYLWHFLLSISTFGLRCVLTQLHRHLVKDDITSGKQHPLSQWLSTIGDSTKKHGKRLKDGLRRSIIQRALNVPVTVDLKALTWLLQRPAMAVRSNVQNLVASIPETTLIQLSNISPEPGQTTILEHISNLFRSCTQGTVHLDENTRSLRLLICLDAFYHIVKPSPGASPTKEVLSEVWTNFENVDTVRKLWADSDPAIRVTSRSICAYLARDLVRNYKSDLLESESSDMTWLQAVMGEPATAITNSLYDPPTMDHMNLKSFVYGVLSNSAGDPLAKRTTCFVETLAVLMNAGSPAALSSDIFKEQLSALIQSAEHEGDQYHEVVTNLRRMLSYMVAHDNRASND